MYRKKRRSWTKHVDFMLLDVLCMQLAFVISYIIRFGTDNPYTDGDYRTLAIAFLFIDFFVEIVSDSFKNVLKRGYFDEFIATCRHVILVELIVTFYLFTTQTGSFYSRFSYYIMVPFYIVTDYAARVIWKKILQKTGFNSAKKSLLIIAPEKILRETLQIVSADRRGYAKVTAVSLDTDLKGKNICGIPIVADRDGIIEYSCGEWVDEVFIPPCAESEYPNELVRAFLEMGIAVHTGITKSGSFPAGCQQVEKIGVYTVITTSMNYAESSKLLVKRLMDIAGGLVGCLITLLITIIVGPMIYISSPGPIFFAQERIGRNGRKFKMYKFRSMYMDAEERKKELMAQNKISDGLMFKMDFDPRIIGNKILPDGTRKTGIGEFIRKTSLDEFPQFINSLKKHPEYAKNNEVRMKAFAGFKKWAFKDFSDEYIGYAALREGGKKYSAVITGSDQLWSPAGLPTNYYNLMFVPDDTLKISIASSFGVKEIPWYQKKRTIQYLNRIEYISMRENRGSEIVKELTGRDVPTILDPVFFLSRNEWLERIPNKREINEPWLKCQT